jgi:hypothetical protein
LDVPCFVTEINIPLQKYRLVKKVEHVRIENFVEQNNLIKAEEYACLYRLEGFLELRQIRCLFRLRFYTGFKFDHFLTQCTYLEAISRGLETDGDFQTLFNRKQAKSNIPIHELPRPLTVESIVGKMSTIYSAEKLNRMKINSP